MKGFNKREAYTKGLHQKQLLTLHANQKASFKKQIRSPEAPSTLQIGAVPAELDLRQEEDESSSVQAVLLGLLQGC